MQYQGKTLRHEFKYYINYDIYYVLRSRLQNVLYKDEHMPDDEGYLISSLYFDDMYDSALKEKISGTRFRKKFRIRSYELNDTFIRLECKSKFDEYISKTSAKLTKEEYMNILNGDMEFLLYRKERVCQELYGYYLTKRLRPSVVVEYRREAYIYPYGNVRITFDKNISASTRDLDMFSPKYHTAEVLDDDIMVMEV